MDGHGVGRLQLPQLGEIVLCQPVVKEDGESLRGRVDGLNPAHVAVEDASPHRAAVGFFPEDVVVVANLHHPISLPELIVAVGALLFVRRLGIQRRLKKPV